MYDDGGQGRGGGGGNISVLFLGLVWSCLNMMTGDG